MPASKYTPKPAIYDCLQYTGNNFDDLAAFAPVTKDEEGKVYLTTAVGVFELPVGFWVMKDVFLMYMMTSNELFQLGYRPGGGPG